MRTFAALLVLAAVAAACAHARPSLAERCNGSQLTGRFAVVPGSAGAGNILYRLTLTNSAGPTCTLTGLPSVTLLGKNRHALPTHVVPAHRGALTAVLVTLAHGRHTTATARFSPDVPGVGEGGPKCEPTAYWLRVQAQGRGTTTVPVRPPTSVCEHGSLQMTAYTR